jgi:hypothetical protein
VGFKDDAKKHKQKKTRQIYQNMKPLCFKEYHQEIKIKPTKWEKVL